MWVVIADVRVGLEMSEYQLTQLTTSTSGGLSFGDIEQGPRLRRLCGDFQLNQAILSCLAEGNFVGGCCCDDLRRHRATTCSVMAYFNQKASASSSGHNKSSLFAGDRHFHSMSSPHAEAQCYSLTSHHSRARATIGHTRLKDGQSRVRDLSCEFRYGEQALVVLRKLSKYLFNENGLLCCRHKPRVAKNREAAELRFVVCEKQSTALMATSRCV